MFKRLFAISLLILSLASCMTKEQQTSFDYINFSRWKTGLNILTQNNEATVLAQDWANYLAANGLFEHSDLTKVIEKIGAKAVGENLASGYNLLDIHIALLNSPPHRDNILGNYNQLGIGVATRQDGSIIVVQLFLLM